MQPSLSFVTILIACSRTEPTGQCPVNQSLLNRIPSPGRNANSNDGHRSEGSPGLNGHSTKRQFAGWASSTRGGTHKTQAEAILGWDAVNKTVYYLDCHGASTVFKGSVKLEGDDLIFDFATVIGTPAKWREVLKFPDHETMQFTIFGEKEGKWAPVVTQTSTKNPESSATSSTRVIATRSRSFKKSSLTSKGNRRTKNEPGNHGASPI